MSNFTNNDLNNALHDMSDQAIKALLASEYLALNLTQLAPQQSKTVRVHLEQASRSLEDAIGHARDAEKESTQIDLAKIMAEGDKS